MSSSLCGLLRSVGETDTEDETTPSTAVKNECQAFKLTKDQLVILMELMSDVIPSDHEHKVYQFDYDRMCYPVFFRTSPEHGLEQNDKFLALDLSGTYFRILLHYCINDGEHKMKSAVYKVSAEIQTDSGVKLFDYIASCISEFIKEKKLNTKEPLPLGFTYSFSLKQEGLDSSGVVGEDVGGLLKDAIKRRKDIRVDVVSVLNETAGTLMACLWINPDTKIGLISGTCCNSCYPSNDFEFEIFDSKKQKEDIVINTEWGAFGENGQLAFLYTRYDAQIDNLSSNPGKQRFEKMIKGKYMGELVRIIIEQLAMEKKLFGGKISKQFLTKGAFLTSYISEIEKNKEDYRTVRNVLEKMGIINASNLDCVNVQHICECVSIRSAQMVAAALAGLINKLKELTFIIAIDDSVYHHHPNFKSLMLSEMKTLVDGNFKIDSICPKDQSGYGAELVSAEVIREALEN